MLPLLQYLHELQNGLVVSVKLLLAGDQLLLSLGEGNKLLQSFLVHMAILFQFSVALVQFLPQLWEEGQNIRTSFSKLDYSISVP